MTCRHALPAERSISIRSTSGEASRPGRRGNLEWLGSLSKASCECSIHNYECGSLELIAIYDAMLTTDGVYGGRFSGAGFKGAFIDLVDPGKKEQIEKEIIEKYSKYDKHEDISCRYRICRYEYRHIVGTAQ